MRFIDPHLHANIMEDSILQNLVMAGMEAAVIPAPHIFKGIADADTVFRLWRRLLDFDIKTAKLLGFEAFISLSIPFYGLNSKDIDECAKQLPEYLKNKRVVAMGEIGLDAGIKDEEELFRTQLQIAKKHDLPIIVHSPIRNAPQSPEVIRQIVKVIKEEKFDISRVVLDHTAENTFEYRLSTGAYVGLSVCFDKMPPEAAANLVYSNPGKRDRLLINTEVPTDMYFTVPRVMLAMKQLGMKSKEIEQVVYDNPKKLFKLPLEDN
jgi:predicted metal-dependent TIM-barrel fold hydrolase